MTETYLDRIGGLIRDARKHRGLTQTQLADVLGTSQSAVHRIEAGNQNLSLEMVSRIAEALDSPLISVGGSGPQHLRVKGGANLTGTIEVRSSKNAAVALLCASLLNRGRTVIRGIAKIEEVNRIIEVLTSIGVRVTWSSDGNDLELVRPADLSLDAMDLDAARHTRSVLMFLGPLLHSYTAFKLPYAGVAILVRAPSSRICRCYGASAWTWCQPTASTTAPWTSRSSVPGRSPSPNAATPSPRTRCSLRRCREG